MQGFIGRVLYFCKLFKFGLEENEAFEKLKRELTSGPIFRSDPDSTGQWSEDALHVLFSKRTSDLKSRYHSFEQLLKKIHLRQT